MKKILTFFKGLFAEKASSDQASKESIETGKALYEYFQKQVEHERNRFYKLEDKASKFLTMISVIITAYLFFINKFIDTFSTFCSLSKLLQIYQIILIILLTLLFLSLCISWFYLLRVFKLQTTRHLPSNKETIEAYIKNPNKLNEIYHDNANKMEEVVNEYKSTNKIKVAFLSKGYKFIAISGFLFAIIIPLSIIYKYLI